MIRSFVFVCLAAGCAQAQSDPLPVRFLPGGAEAEGCYAQWSTRSLVHAYSAPTESSQRLRSVDGERRIDANDYSESLTAVLESGTVRTKAPVEVFGVRVGGDESATFTIPAGREISILAEGPEESVTFEYQGRVYSGFVPDVRGGGDIEILGRPVTELWVRLVAHSADRPAAWINTAQAGMAPREAFCR